MSETEIVNRVQNSGLVVLELDQLLPEVEIVELDIADFLFQGLILKEKEFRTALKELDLDRYKDKVVAVSCSADAIIPMWAYMLVASVLNPVASALYFGDTRKAREQFILSKVRDLDLANWEAKRVVVKGCSGEDVPESVYLELSTRLTPVVQSLMFGEPCSTVPVFKKPRNKV